MPEETFSALNDALRHARASLMARASVARMEDDRAEQMIHRLVIDWRRTCQRLDTETPDEIAFDSDAVKRLWRTTR
jgi:hypothetical protein